MMNKQITLCIGGTPHRRGGYQELAIIGLFPADQFANMDRTTLFAEKPVWSIKHTPEYIVYQLIDRNILYFDNPTNGMLSIALTIPKDMQLSDGKSPYTLLKSIYDKFRNEYITSSNDGGDKFLDKKVDPESFQQIVAQYSLEPRKGRYVEMKGSLTGTLCVPQNKMEDFFRDSQYAEFANFKDIEIGTSCNSTMGLELLEIPRPVSYEIIVNGIKQPVSLSKPSDGYTTRLNNTEDYKYQNISFTLGDLMASENGIYTQGASSVELDKENRQILCSVRKVEIKYKGTLKFIGKPGNKDVVQRAVENEEIRIDLGNSKLMDYQTSGLEFEIPSKLLRNSSFSITPNKTKQGLKLSVMASIHQDQQEITIEVAIREEERKPVVIPADRKDKYSTHTNKLPQKQTFQKEEDTYEEEERKRKDPAEKNKLLVKGFVAGFVSALVLCCLGFGAYWMFKGDEPDSQFKEQITQKDERIRELEQEMENLKDDWLKDKGQLTDSINTLNKIINEKTKLSGTNQVVKEKNVISSENVTDKEKAKAEILKLVNKRDIKCLNHPQYHLLSKTEKLGVENILKPNGKGVLLKKKKDYLGNKTFDNWQQIEFARQEIITLESNHKNRIEYNPIPWK